MVTVFTSLSSACKTSGHSLPVTCYSFKHIGMKVYKKAEGKSEDSEDQIMVGQSIYVWICICVETSVCGYMCMHVCMTMCTCRSLSECMCVPYICEHVCIYVDTCMHVHIYVYKCVYIEMHK